MHGHLRALSDRRISGMSGELGRIRRGRRLLQAHGARLQRLDAAFGRSRVPGAGAPGLEFGYFESASSC